MIHPVCAVGDPGVVELLRSVPGLRWAAATGLVTALLCSVLSPFVVHRRLAFAGQGISHAALGGIGLSVLLLRPPGVGDDPAVMALTAGFCLVVAVLIARTSGRGRLSEDSAIGVFFAVSMAIGGLCLWLARWPGEAFGYLFGSLLAVGPADLAAAGVLTAVVCATVWLLWRPLVYFTFDPTQARVSGVPVTALHYGLMCALALVVVVSVKLVGVVLVSAFLVIPGAAGTFAAGRFRGVMLVSIGIGVAGTAVGLWLSLAFDLPPGSAIVLVLFAAFLAAMAYGRLRGTGR